MKFSTFLIPLVLAGLLAACNQSTEQSPAAQPEAEAESEDGGDSFELEIDGENDSVTIKAEDDDD